MSTDTQNSQNQGENRRRRSRGGQNRNRNNNSESNRSTGRQSGGGSRTGNRSDNRSSGGGPKGGAGKSKRRMPAPQLSWWQKLLKSLGLYKEPVRPPRPERRTSKSEEAQPHRTRTRDARSSDKGSGSDEDSAPRGKKRSGSKNTNRPRGGDPSTVENRRVYVGNLSYDSTENDIEELFKGVGAVRTVEIVYNRKTHRSKGYGFVEMIDIDEAKRTVEVLHDQFFMGRKLTVSGAKSKDHQDAENEEGSSDSSKSSIPQLAPTHPKKEEVTNLIDDSKKEEVQAEPKQEAAKPVSKVITEESCPEVPTEEFSPEEDTPEEIKDKAES